MGYIKKDNLEKRDYRERFEFILTTRNTQTGEKNIICQRYFKIGGINELSLSSSRIRDVIIRCAKRINKDLTCKSNLYTSLMAPMVFSTEEEMNTYLADPKHAARLTPGEGIVIRDEKAPNYVWSFNGPRVCPTKFDKVEFTHELTDEDYTEFTFTFKDHATFFMKDGVRCMDPLGNKAGREVCSYTWTNILPTTIKRSIDLSNRNSRVTKEEMQTLNGESWVIYKLAENRSDLIYPIISDICEACCVKDDSYYTDADPYGEEEYIF